MLVVSMLQSLGFPESIISIYTNFTIPITLVLVALLGLIAFFGYRILKYAIKLIAAVSFAVLGNFFVLDLIRDFVAPVLPESFSVAAVMGLVFALLGLVLSIFCYKFVMFLAGGGLAFMLSDSIIGLIGTFVSLPSFLTEGIGKTILSIILALIVGLIVMYFFKLIYIVATSVGSLALAFALVVIAIIPTADSSLVGVAVAIGAIIGLVAMFLQFKADSKVRLIRL